MCIRDRLSPYWVSIGGAALTANMVPGYSSFGPTPDGQLKPDIVATGGWDTSYSGLSGGFYVPTQSFDAYDSALYSANGFMAVDGTSFSAALTAGAAALVIQAHPGLRGTQVRSLIVNSSAQTVTTDDSANPVDEMCIRDRVTPALLSYAFWVPRILQCRSETQPRETRTLLARCV